MTHWQECVACGACVESRSASGSARAPLRYKTGRPATTERPSVDKEGTPAQVAVDANFPERKPL